MKIKQLRLSKLPSHCYTFELFSLVSIYRVDIVVQNSFRPSTTQSISFTDLLGKQMIDRIIYMCEFLFFSLSFSGFLSLCSWATA